MSQQNRTKMSVTQLTLLTAINMMGSGIVMLPTKLAEIGTISILPGSSLPWAPCV